MVDYRFETFCEPIYFAGAPKSFVNYRFPPQPQTNNTISNANDKDNLANTIVQFCFPESEQWINPKFMQDKKKMCRSFCLYLII